MAAAHDRKGAETRRTLRFGGKTVGWAPSDGERSAAHIKDCCRVPVRDPDLQTELSVRASRDKPGTPGRYPAPSGNEAMARRFP